MTKRTHFPGLGQRLGTIMTSAAAGALVIAASSGTAGAQGAFDTTNPDYLARAAQLVADGRILEKCLPSSAPAPDAGWAPIPEPSAELVAAAAKEGEVVLNSGISDKPSIDAFTAAFELRYPDVHLTVASGGSATLEERFLADHASGNQQADAEISNKLEWVSKALEIGAIEPIDKTIPGFLDQWPEGPWRWTFDDGTAAVALYRVLGISYNSDLVKGDAVPDGFEDLANPAFKDQVLAVDPEASLTYARAWKQIWNVVGDDGMKAIGANMIKNPLYSDIQVLAQALGAGAGMVSMEMGLNVAQTMQQNGAPVATVIPASATGPQYVLGVATDAPHPNAAKLFAHWLYSAEGQWVTSCSALAGTVAYGEFGAKDFVPIDAVSKDDIATMKALLGL